MSAGGIVVRKRQEAWQVVVVQDMNDAWTFPKGKIYAGEEPEQAARREILEEVGLRDIRMHTTLPVIQYIYQKNGRISKTVQYYIFESSGDEPLVSQTEEGIHNATWMQLEKAIKIIGYPKTNLSLLLKVKQWTLHRHRT